MQDTPPNRSTFLTLHDVLEIGRRHTARARAELIVPMREAATDERSAMFLASLDQKRRELEEAFEASAAECPESVLETRVQYIVPPSEEGARPPLASASVEDLVEWIPKFDAPILTTFRDLAERASQSHARELFGRLAALLESHHQKLSRNLQEMHDV